MSKGMITTAGVSAGGRERQKREGSIFQPREEIGKRWPKKQIGTGAQEKNDISYS